MLFFYLSLLIGIFGTAALAYAFGRSLDRNFGRRNKRPISYLAPVFISLFLIYFSIDYTAPRLFDLVTILSDNYKVTDVTLTENQIHWSSLIVDGQPYYYDRFQFKPKPETRYRLTVLPNSHHVVKLESITDSSASGGLYEP